MLWGAFESNTWAMARCGWEFALHEHPYSVQYLGIARHRETGMVLHLEGDAREFTRHLDPWQREGPPVWVVKHWAHERNYLVRAQFNAAEMRRIDVAPSWEEKPFHELGIFKPWSAKEIVVEPRTVQQLMEEIQNLQQPELAEIRRRNRQRAQREEVVAQVIAFAA